MAAVVGFALVGTGMFSSSDAVAQAAAKSTHKKKTASTKKAASPSKRTAHHTAKKTSTRKTTSSSRRRSASKRHVTRKKRHAAPRPTAQSRKLTSAFHATEKLRPMAQQLIATRSAAAYRGVESYAKAHPGEGAATAYLALGHAYMLDHRYIEAADAYRKAAKSGKSLDDYADYLGAQASLQAGNAADANTLLGHFA